MTLTSEEFARKLNLSRSTISRALNRDPRVKDSTRRRIIEAMKEYGYTPNRAALKLKAKRVNAIGLVILRDTRYIFSDPFYAEVITALEATVNEFGYNLQITTISDRNPHPQKLAQVLEMTLVDGLLLMCLDVNAEKELRNWHDQPAPVAVVGRTSPETGIPFVDVDNQSGAYQATNHLIELGHSRIGFLSGIPGLYGTIDRETGYRKALADAGIEIDESLIVRGDYSLDSGYGSMLALLDGPHRPTAVFAANDLIAMGAMKAIRERGLLVPDDVSVVGFNDSDLAIHVEPPLTSVHQPSRLLGSEAANLIIRLVEGRGLKQHSSLLPVRLVVRESTGKKQSNIRMEEKR